MGCSSSKAAAAEAPDDDDHNKEESAQFPPEQPQAATPSHNNSSPPPGQQDFNDDEEDMPSYRNSHNNNGSSNTGTKYDDKSVKELRNLCKDRGVSMDGCLEKGDLVEALKKNDRRNPPKSAPTQSTRLPKWPPTSSTPTNKPAAAAGRRPSNTTKKPATNNTNNPQSAQGSRRPSTTANGAAKKPAATAARRPSTSTPAAKRPSTANGVKKPSATKPASGRPGGANAPSAARKKPAAAAATNKPAAAGRKPVGGGAKPGAKPGAAAAKPGGAAKPPGRAAAAPPKKAAAASGVPEEYRDADPSKWKLMEYKFAGSASYESMGKSEDVKQPIAKGIQHFQANPGKYTAMMYQTSMTDWPTNQQQYNLVHRMGTLNWKPQGTSPSGWMTLLVWEYQALPPLPNNELPSKFRDKYTDGMTHCRRKLHSSKNKPILPGRGMGVCDSPLIKIIGDVDPSDIHQGMVGDCWLLSAISALAEFDGAVKRLFRKTPNLDQRPYDGPNQYTVTLWDLPTWKEVDIVIDERLPVASNGSGKLLASKPSEDGELWVCYLEKALAMHCGGWDKITGGQCTHGWALMTGCKHQYMIKKNEKTGKYGCFGLYNPLEKRWNKHANSPHDGDHRMWPVAWPEVGGGGGETEITMKELFLKLVAWDQVNYIVGAGTKGKSDKNKTDGLVDNHAYSVIESHTNVCGTGIDLLKVRNPWGKGEIEDGDFDDDGPGWDKYPQIKRKLNPVVADDGIFWVTKEEFFHYYQTIYLSASNMTEFLED